MKRKIVCAVLVFIVLSIALSFLSEGSRVPFVPYFLRMIPYCVAGLILFSDHRLPRENGVFWIGLAFAMLALIIIPVINFSYRITECLLSSGIGNFASLILGICISNLVLR